MTLFLWTRTWVKLKHTCFTVLENLINGCYYNKRMKKKKKKKKKKKNLNKGGVTKSENPAIANGHRISKRKRLIACVYHSIPHHQVCCQRQWRHWRRWCWYPPQRLQIQTQPICQNKNIKSGNVFKTNKALCWSKTNSGNERLTGGVDCWEKMAKKTTNEADISV